MQSFFEVPTIEAEHKKYVLGRFQIVCTEILSRNRAKSKLSCRFIGYLLGIRSNFQALYTAELGINREKAFKSSLAIWRDVIFAKTIAKTCNFLARLHSRLCQKTNEGLVFLCSLLLWQVETIDLSSWIYNALIYSPGEI